MQLTDNDAIVNGKFTINSQLSEGYAYKSIITCEPVYVSMKFDGL